MALSKKRILQLVVLVLLVIFGMGLYTYFIGTRTLLEHAEKFSFQRMTSAQSPDTDSFRFFFISNRTLDSAQGAIDERFQNERESTLKYGFFDTRVEPTLGLGMVLDSSAWFLNEEIQLLDVQSLQQEEFVRQLRTQVEASTDSSLLIIVHGFREAFPSALRKTSFLAHVLDIDTPVLVFDWPGNQGSSLGGYRRARSLAIASGEELAATLELIIEQVKPKRLWLMANSMGGEVVVNAFHKLYRDADYADSATEVENVVLTAADVDHTEFNQQFKQEIKALADNVTVYVSSNDRALLASRLINRGRRLGESTLNPGNPELLEQAQSFSELLEADNDRLVLVDVTPVNRTRNFHNFSLETPEFFDDLFLRLTGTAMPQTRELYPIQTPDDARYYVLTRGR